MATMDSYKFGRTFPHTFLPAPYLYQPLTTSPFGDELTLDFTQTLIQSEKLGKDSVTDYLAVSFSATDLRTPRSGIRTGPASSSPVT